ncbi:MAG: CxxxxCH/CxxCH domain-containing protein [Anaeromyxobacteraceae bacterium]
MTSRSLHLVVITAAALVAGAGCQSRTVVGAEGATESKCTRCHGGVESDGGAPPRSVKGESSPTALSVGAHSAHVLGPAHLSPKLDCAACHPAPDAANPLAHIDGKVAVRFGPLAAPAGFTASWNRETATCTVYCHGATLADGTNPAPKWNVVSPPQASCGSCHGVPPKAPHPARTDCQRCHAGSLTLGSAPSAVTEKHMNGQVDLTGGCATCHGDSTRVTTDLLKSAPPIGLDGETATTDRAVGAHQAHLAAGPLSKAFECSACHVVPADQLHSDGVVKVTFSGLAGAKGTPTFDTTNATCSVYCHGQTLSGGTLQQPLWTKVDGTQADCGTCHGAPPTTAPHTAKSTACHICHPGTVENDDVTIKVANGMHVNGTVEVNDYHPANWATPTVHGYAANADLASCKSCHGADLAGGGTGISCATCHGATWQSNCTFCHGDANRSANKPAPPVGTQGELATSTRAVGAHQSHLSGGTMSSGVACTECHAVPTDLSHVDGVRKLTWGALATKDGAAPSYTATQTCASTYCHGATLNAGGTKTAPAWTGGAAEAACGTCHGAPPPAPHPTLAACRTCHANTVTAGGAIDLAGGKHVNGTVDVTKYHPTDWVLPTNHGLQANQDLGGCKGCHGADLLGGVVAVSCTGCHLGGSATWAQNCTFCHGTRVTSYTAADLKKAAPPQGTQNETATSTRAVGAHAAHVNGSTLTDGVACDACHAVPADLSHANGTVATAFKTINGKTTTWNGTSCSSSYCHGATLPGGTHTTPAWTGGASEASCGSCHAAPPPSPHPQRAACGGCHPADAGLQYSKAKHADGNLDLLAFSCASCHGDSNRAGTDLQRAAPPTGTGDESATTTLAVGAHQKHVYAGNIGRAFACSDCHPVPSTNLHADGVRQLAFSDFVKTDGAAPAWDRNAATCASTYCHGATLAAGGVATTPKWTQVSAGQTACNSCHGAPPPGPAHPATPDCGRCHTGYTSSSVNAATHINGKLDIIDLTCASCHGDSSRTATGTADPKYVQSAPPTAVNGDTSTATLGVGAHQKHVTAGAVTAGYTCDACHVTPPLTNIGHMDGVLDVSFPKTWTLQGPVAASWTRGTASCASTYCHGNYQGTYQWTTPDDVTHTLDYTGKGATAIWTGETITCSSCHGAPTFNGAWHSGAHGSLGTQNDCSLCHSDAAGTVAGGNVRLTNPALHANGNVDITANKAAAACRSCHL